MKSAMVTMVTTAVSCYGCLAFYQSTVDAGVDSIPFIEDGNMVAFTSIKCYGSSH